MHWLCSNLSFRPARGQTLMQGTVAGRDLLEPRSLGDAVKMLRDEGPLVPLAGCTDLYVALNFGTLRPTRFLNLWNLDALRGIETRGTMLRIGALTTYTDIITSAAVRRRLPMLVAAAREIGGVQIQNRGTLGGNVANASPAGDTLPVLLAADAVFVLGSTRGEREVPAAEFWTAYRRTALAPDELLLRIRIPLATDREVRFRKIGTRRAQSISKVVLAAGWRSDAVAVVPRGAWRDVRVALGSVAATPIRARATEAVLEGRAPTPETADLAAETLAAELSPIDDVRSTAEYRRLVAGRVLHRIVREAGGW